MQTAETLANNEQFMIQRNSFLRPRQEFCKAINEMYGWDCSVKWSVPHMPAESEQQSVYMSSPDLLGYGDAEDVANDADL